MLADERMTMLTDLPSADSPASHWHRWCLDRLTAHEVVSIDPVVNSVRQLALETLAAIEGNVLGLDKIMETARILCDSALTERADSFARSHQPSKAVEAVLRQFDGASFEKIKTQFERSRLAAVLTAHPTFAMSVEASNAFTDLASGRATSLPPGMSHCPNPVIDLESEHAMAQAALANAKAAMRQTNRHILLWARERYPDQWTDLVPNPICFASWVGYDLDGRSDIHWMRMVRLRLQEKAHALSGYVSDLDNIAGIGDLGAQIKQQLTSAENMTRQQIRAFSVDADDTDGIALAGRLLTEKHSHHLTSLTGIINDLHTLIATTSDADVQLELALLRAQMVSCGLGTSEIHFRINSAQIVSALQPETDRITDDVRDRTALAYWAGRARSVEKYNVSLASVYTQQMTGRRQLMLCALILQHIDNDMEIRFLIAECEAPAVIVGALYLARLYGVADHVDISPLFETPDGLDDGARFIARLLAVPEYANYVRQRQRLAVQIGFSDSGRIMGQTGAGMAAERLQGQLARALDKSGIGNVEVVIFNTHGESMGRGGYPGPPGERLDHLFTSWARKRFSRRAIRLRAESSFQGGDGYIHFGSETLAQATVDDLIAWAFQTSDRKSDKADPFYRDKDYSWDFFRRITSWQKNLFERNDYTHTIGTFATQLLFSTGSRRLRRQSSPGRTASRALRAIPHNAILQQLGVPVNVSGGLGTAAGADPERFAAHVIQSHRWQHVVALATEARDLTSLPVLRAYGLLFDPCFWISKATSNPSAPTAGASAELADRLSDVAEMTAIDKLANHLAADLGRFDAVLFKLHGNHRRVERHDRRRTLHALHALRQALVMRAFTLVALLPSFSQDHDLSRASLFALAFEMKFDTLADCIDSIFPPEPGELGALADLAVGDSDATLRAYPEIRDNITQPLRRIYNDIREIGVGISHYYGAYG